MLLDACTWNWHTIIFTSIAYLRQIEGASKPQSLEKETIFPYHEKLQHNMTKVMVKGRDKRMAYR